MPNRRVLAAKTWRTHSHSSILNTHKIKDNWDGVKQRPFSRIEINPSGYGSYSFMGVAANAVPAAFFSDPASWIMIHDDGGSGGNKPPSWWTASHTRAVLAAVRKWQATVSAARTRKMTTVDKAISSNDSMKTTYGTIGKAYNAAYKACTWNPPTDKTVAQNLLTSQAAARKQLKKDLQAIIKSL